MEGRTEIINQALLYCGQDTILDPGGESQNAKLCAQVYNPTLAEVLSEHPWIFAQKAVRLQQVAQTPEDFRFSRQYQLPADYGRIVRVYGGIEDTWDDYRLQPFGDKSNTIPLPEYTVQGDKLLCNQVELQIVYVRSYVDPFEMTPQFRNYFSAAIAQKLYFKLTGEQTGAATLTKTIVALQLAAKRIDSNQTDTMASNLPNLFIRARVY